MPNLPVISAALLLLLSPSFQGIEAIDMKSAEEMVCIPINKTVPVDTEWLMSRSAWYYPLMSRMDLYTGAVDVSKMNPNEISEDHVYYDSCPRMEINQGQLTAYFFDRNKTFSLKSKKGLIEIFELHDDGGLHGTGHMVLTDNKTFGVIIFCMANTNQMSWGLLSALKTLPNATVVQIHNHVESLGFKREQFTGIRYDLCKPE